MDIEAGGYSRWVTAQIRHDLESSVPQSEVRRRLAANEYGFNHISFNKLNRQQAEQDDYICNPYEVEEGVIQCKQCGSYRVYSVSVQTRACDEPTSVHAVCTQCKKKWTQN
jgi:DNA-directed RNA polymerase subunit M/transcription elongation factor TFIIS